jgi:hypothetical protein
MQHFDFGRADGTLTEPSELVTHRYGVPEALHSWLTWAAEGFAPAALGAAGAANVKVRSDNLGRDGEVKGFPTITQRLTIRWD